MLLKHVPGISNLYADDSGGIHTVKAGGLVKVPQSKTAVGGYYQVHFKDDASLAHSMARVHRLVCAAFHGIPEGAADLLVRHLDGNPGNNRPENLAWGTDADNHSDAKRHGRVPCGEDAHNARLTNEIVVRIGELRRSGWSCGRIAEEVGASVGSVDSVVAGRTWGHIDSGEKPRGKVYATKANGRWTGSTKNRGTDNKNAKLTDDAVREIRRLCETRELRQREIAEKFGVSQGLVTNIYYRRVWKHVVD